MQQYPSPAYPFLPFVLSVTGEASSCVLAPIKYPLFDMHPRRYQASRDPRMDIGFLLASNPTEEEEEPRIRIPSFQQPQHLQQTQQRQHLRRTQQTQAQRQQQQQAKQQEFFRTEEEEELETSIHTFHVSPAGGDLRDKHNKEDSFMEEHPSSPKSSRLGVVMPERKRRHRISVPQQRPRKWVLNQDGTSCRHVLHPCKFIWLLYILHIFSR